MKTLLESSIAMMEMADPDGDCTDLWAKDMRAAISRWTPSDDEECGGYDAHSMERCVYALIYDAAKRFANGEPQDFRVVTRDAIDAAQEPLARAFASCWRRAYAQCGYCQRYSDDPNTVGDNPQPLCDCGEKYGWSGSFVPPTVHSEWSGTSAPLPPPAPDIAPMYKALIEARLALLVVNSFASGRAIRLIDAVLNAAPQEGADNPHGGEVFLQTVKQAAVAMAQEMPERRETHALFAALSDHSGTEHLSRAEKDRLTALESASQALAFGDYLADAASALLSAMAAEDTADERDMRPALYHLWEDRVAASTKVEREIYEYRKRRRQKAIPSAILSGSEARDHHVCESQMPQPLPVTIRKD